MYNSMLIIDLNSFEVHIEIGVVEVEVFSSSFRLCNLTMLQQNLAIESSNFFCLFNNSRRSADSTNQ